jgi:hypothetical protein
MQKCKNKAIEEIIEHAFLSGFVACMNIPAYEEKRGMDEFKKYQIPEFARRIEKVEIK